MNRAFAIKNWNEGGNNYVLKGKSSWIGFNEKTLIDLSVNFNNDFNIVIWIDEQIEDDYYCIPFKAVKDVFVEEHMTTGKSPNRWTAVIQDNQFLMHGNSQLSVNISSFYGNPLFDLPSTSITDDFFIENAKAEINIRLGQSKFRKGVLKNFENKCALTNISEQSLLTASHIVPWSHKKDFRGDISNGICLYIEYDALFDKGFISFTDNLKTLIVSDTSKFSTPLKEKLQALNQTQLSQPINKALNIEYLEYHRRKIFRG